MAYTTINKSTAHFNTKLFTGDGTSDRGITGVGFQPDLVWLKARSKANDNNLFDAVRGLYKLRSNSNAAQASVSSEFKSFDSDGITVTENATSEFNNNNTTYALWNWKANGAGSANTDGSINSTVSVNQTAGFSIVKWTGTQNLGTVGHGLSVTPKMIIIKNTSALENWIVYHNSLGNTKNLYLDEANAEHTRSDTFNNTSPTSSVFTVNTATGVNKTGSTMIAYCFAEKKGFSKFNSYTGNGNANGTFVYTGFKPAFVLTKYATSNSGWWQILDNKRDVYNPNSHALFANVNDSEYNLSNYHTDYLSNGFKLRNTQAGGNTSGATYIYMAFAEAPLVGTNGVTAKAR